METLGAHFVAHQYRRLERLSMEKILILDCVEAGHENIKKKMKNFSTNAEHHRQEVP